MLTKTEKAADTAAPPPPTTGCPHLDRRLSALVILSASGDMTRDPKTLLDMYADKFRAEEVDIDCLPHLDDADFYDIGIPLLVRRLLAD